MKIQAAIITIAIVIMVILSVTAFSTFSFATRITTNSSSSSSSSSTGAQRTTTVTSTTGTVDVSLKSQRPLPSAGIPVIVTYSGAAAGQPIPSHFNAKEQPNAVQIPTGHYDVSVSFSYPLPDVHPKYLGDCRGTIKAADHLNCIIDPYGHAVSTDSQSTTTTTNTTRVPSQMTTTTNPVTHNATLTGGSGCSNVNFLWNHVYGVPGNGKEQWNRPNPTHTKTPSRLTELNSCVTVTGQVYSIYPPPSPGRGTHDDDDGDLHFTLTLLDHTQYSNPNDPQCTSSHGLPNPCHNIIVEVICHKTPTWSYITQWGNYCKTSTGDVNPVHYPHGQFPAQGDKLSVSGKLVTDEGEGKWNEIHPASDIHKIP